MGPVKDVVTLLFIQGDARFGFYLENVAYDPGLGVWSFVLDGWATEILASFQVRLFVTPMASALASLIADGWCVATVYVTYQKLVVFTASVNRFDIAL
jgi:hypothetical protein